MDRLMWNYLFHLKQCTRNNSCSSSWSWGVTQENSMGIPEFHNFWQCIFPEGTGGSTPETPEAASHRAPSPAWGSPCSQTHPASLRLGCPQRGQPYCLPDGMAVWDLDGFKLSLSIRENEKAAFQVAQTSSVWKSFPSPASCDWGEIFHLFSALHVRVFRKLRALHHIGLDAQTAGGSSYSKGGKENNELLEQHWPLQ